MQTSLLENKSLALSTSEPLWRLSATEIAAKICRRDISAREATLSVLDRVDELNPRFNALAEVWHGTALDAADAADKQQALAQKNGQPLGALHGVPISIKINVDIRGHATTDGAPALLNNIATSDSPIVASLREAGAICIGRNNAPAFSLRWFTENELYGATLNPFNTVVTPGGSSGGAAVATALGMGAIAHGNDYGGSIRYPAWACGVVGLRTTVGRIASYKASAPNRIVTNQLMSVQGPLTRTISDARLALSVMAKESHLDPQWVPAPLHWPNAAEPTRVALFKHWGDSPVDASVANALEEAARWLEKAGYVVEEVAPPHFAEVAAMQFSLVMTDMRRAGAAYMRTHGDQRLKRAIEFYLAVTPELNRDDYLEALARRFSIARDWAVFFEKYPLLLMPNSWQQQLPVDDDQQSPERTREILLAQAPLLSTAVLGLPGLSVPTGMNNKLPKGVQLVSARFREDRLLAAGEIIERAAGFSALQTLNF